MSFLGWITLAGCLLLGMALLSAFLRRLPVTPALIYLAVGLAISPLWLDLMAIDFIGKSMVFEHLAEVVVIISLFVCGLKLRLPLTHSAWVPAFLLAGPVMLASIAGVAVFSHFVLGFGWPVAFLLGAILAPTDPVLAGMVSVKDARDMDRMRYGLSGEAGFNDGAAFPFVIFALHWIEHGGVDQWAVGWAMQRVVWSIPAGLVLGFFLGRGVGHFAIRLRNRNPDTGAPNDLLALALIALAYAGAEAAGAWGFLAVFAAGLGFRRTEVLTTSTHPALERSTDPATEPTSVPHPPAEHLEEKAVTVEDFQHPTKAVGHILAEIITFGDTAERLLELLVVVMLGVCLATYWDWRAVPLALVLFIVIRPVSTLLFLSNTRTRFPQRRLMGWFGIRGIGSLYYLAYALNQGLKAQVSEIVGITLSVVALSVAVHGLSSQLLNVSRPCRDSRPNLR
jgi:NhaP-type Na+/H+ or K+/H+ antiporter